MIYPFNFSFSLSLLFMGFLLSNIFGILGSSKSIVFLFIFSIELINYFVYTTKFSRTRKTTPLNDLLVEKSLSPRSLWKTKILSVSFLSTFLIRFKKLVQTIFSGAVDKENISTNFVQRKQNNLRETSSQTFHSRKLPREHLKNLLIITTILNFFKIGFEFGFFMDAFKLGS